MQQGRGGMGSHKHGISGHSGPNGRVKVATVNFFNAAAKRKAQATEKRKNLQGFAHSVRGLLRKRD